MINSKNVKQELLQLLEKQKLFGIEYINQVSFQKSRNLNIELPDNLEKLNSHISNCALCSLSKTKKSITFSRGKKSSKIMLITLHDELLEEKKFIKFEIFLNKELNLYINDIYITNILKCNVNKYSDRLDDEISKCLPYLEQQISLVKPELIITLGSSFRYLMDNSEILTDISGNIYNYRDIKVIPLLGLDFISKNPSYKDRMFNDIVKIKNLMDIK